MHNEAQKLAALAARGDRDALATLVRSLQDVLYRVCLARLGDESTARDATQEAALRVVRGIKVFRGASSVTTWAIGVAINVCREQTRHRKTATQEPQWFDDRADRDEGPVAKAATLESRQLVRRLLKELPQRQAEAVTLRHLEQLSVAETAAAMGCSEGAVKAAVWQGLKTLRNWLEKQT